jgi:integrase/recombinase XerD
MTPIATTTSHQRPSLLIVNNTRPPSDYGDWMLAQRLRPNTITQRVDFADWRHREWGTWDLTSSTLAAWLNTYAGWTALTYHSHLSSIYKWQTDIGALEANPMTGVRRPPTPRPKPKPLSPSEVMAVLDGVAGHLRTWILLALFAGLRVHEIAKFRGEDIDAMTIYVEGKGGRAASLPTHPELWEIAQRYPRRGLWFPSPVREGESYSPDHISGQIADRFRAVGIEKGSIHRLRATYGTRLLRSGVNLRVVQTLMRHSSLATTEHYLGVDEDERMAAIKLLAA